MSEASSPLTQTPKQDQTLHNLILFQENLTLLRNQIVDNKVTLAVSNVEAMQTYLNSLVTLLQTTPNFDALP